MAAYDAFYLLPTAPLDVIKAVYRVMSIRHHPDHGGDTTRMTYINIAYQMIMEAQSK